MDYHSHHRYDHANKENEDPRKGLKFEELPATISKLQNEIKKKDEMLQENNHLNHKIKSELLQVSKKEVEEYANNMEIYSQNFLEIKEQNDALQHQIEQLKKRGNHQQEKMQTLTAGIEQQSAVNRRKDEQIEKLSKQNMSIQHGVV